MLSISFTSRLSPCCLFRERELTEFSTLVKFLFKISGKQMEYPGKSSGMKVKRCFLSVIPWDTVITILQNKCYVDGQVWEMLPSLVSYWRSTPQIISILKTTWKPCCKEKLVCLIVPQTYLTTELILGVLPLLDFHWTCCCKSFQSYFVNWLSDSLKLFHNLFISIKYEHVS